jgi:Protein of unknown function (DUF998)
LHFLPTGYSPVHNAVSDYGAGSYSSLFRISLWSGSIAVLVLTVGLALGVGSPPLVNRDLVFLGLVAVAWIGESLFPTTVEGERLTRTGALHYLFAILTFGFTYAAISGLTPVLVKLHPWHSEKVCWTAWPGQSWSGLYSSWPTRFREGRWSNDHENLGSALTGNRALPQAGPVPQMPSIDDMHVCDPSSAP